MERQHQSDASTRSETPRRAPPARSTAPTRWSGDGPALSDGYLAPLSAPLYPKLEVGGTNDPAERAADAFADAVVRGGPMPPLAEGGGGLRRKCSACEQEDDKLHRKERGSGGGGGGGSLAPPVVHRALASPGHGLDAGARRGIEARAGLDLSGVRVHTDALAAESAAAVGARAYTVGRDLVFGAGEYRPGSQDGLRLIAHEVGHLGSGVVRREQVPGGQNELASEAAGKHAGRPQPLLDKLLLSYRNRRELGGTAWHGLDNGFPRDASPPPTFEQALDGFKERDWSILENTWRRLSRVGLWGVVESITFVWESASAEGYDIGVSPSKLQAALSSSRHFCLDTLPFDHFYSKKEPPPVKEFLTKYPWYREIGCGGEALHMSAARSPTTWGAFMHIDKTGIAQQKNPFTGTCMLCPKATLEHGRDNIGHFGDQARDILRDLTGHGAP